MLRLIAYAPDGVQRFPIRRNQLLIGSEPDCDVYLPYTGVAQQHARLSYDGNELEIEDLGSRRGVLVSGQKVRHAPLEPLDEVRLGSVTLLVEDVSLEDRPTVEIPEPAPVPVQLSPDTMLAHLQEISHWVLADVESRTPLETLVSHMLKEFGGGILLLLQGELAGESGIKFVRATDASWLSRVDDLLDQIRDAAAEGTDPAAGFDGRLGDHSCRISWNAFRAVEKGYVVVLGLIGEEAKTGWSPGSSLGTLGDLLVLGLVHHVGTYEPILPGRQPADELVLDPDLLIGESTSMQQTIAHLRRALDPEVNILLRGETGVGKQLLARSLHLSSSRRNGPFVATTCAGASPAILEASLFGAEIPGKDGPVRREGKLFLADGGTLFLDDIELLPLDLQARLVRFLRSGEIEIEGSGDASRVDVRLVAASASPLESYVARDVFRVDLAYRLGQFAIDVPPVRARREDLPLLIQSAINRCCHETGKRMQGISVKAMSALMSYDYPGNLEELDNIARQLVYLCPPGRPIDESLLPENVRLSKVQEAGRVDPSSDLDLERLVAATERSAIREALKRSNGNKSQAARLLGLSRNGLAMKMERHGLSLSPSKR